MGENNLGRTENKPKSLIDKIKDGDVAYEDLPIDTQVEVYQMLHTMESRSPEAVLLQASENRKHDFSLIRGDESCPMDRNVYKVNPGQYVVVTYETSTTGWSRAQAGFVSNVINDSLVNPSITIAKLPDVLDGVDLIGKSREEIRALLLDHVLSGGSIEDIGIDEKHRLIEEMQGQGYSQVTLVAEVKERPSMANDGGLILSGQEGGMDLDIDMSNVRLLHVVGVNVPKIKGVTPQNN